MILNPTIFTSMEDYLPRNMKFCMQQEPNPHPLYRSQLLARCTAEVIGNYKPANYWMSSNTSLKFETAIKFDTKFYPTICFVFSLSKFRCVVTEKPKWKVFRRQE